MSLEGVNLVMAIVGFVLSTLFISFVCIRLIIARVNLAISSRAYQLECGFRGLESRSIDNFPTKKYKDSDFQCSHDSECVICLAEYCRGNTLRILPNCGHFFHVLCIDKWLSLHSTCPVCRISLREFSKIPLMPPMYSSYVQPRHCLESHDRRMRGHGDRRVDVVRENLVHTESLEDETGESVLVAIEGMREKSEEESPSNT